MNTALVIAAVICIYMASVYHILARTLLLSYPHRPIHLPIARLLNCLTVY